MGFTKVIISGVLDTVRGLSVKFNSLIDALLSTDSGKGASQIGVEDSAEKFTGTNVETVLAELSDTTDDLGDDINDLSDVFPTFVASKYGALAHQNDDDDGFDLLTSQGNSGQVLKSAGGDAVPGFADIFAANLSANDYRLTDLGDAVDLHDGATLHDVLNSVGLVMNYWLMPTSLLSNELVISSASGAQEITGAAGETELTTVDTFFKSTVANTPTPFVIKDGTIILTHFEAKVDLTTGKKPTVLHAKLYRVNSDGSGTPQQIGSDTDSTTELTIVKTLYQLHLHVPTEKIIVANSRLWLRIFATTTGTKNNPTVRIYNGDVHGHVTIPVSGSILGRFLLLAGGTMTGDIAMGGSQQVTGLQAPSASGETIRQTASITEAALGSTISASHSQNSDTGLGGLGTKDPPIDADKWIYRDSTASDALVTSTGTQVKAYLKTYFDGLYTGGADTDVIEMNILLLAFKIAVADSLTKFNMVDGVSDAFVDESGVDTGASTGEKYDSDGDYYSPGADVLIDKDTGAKIGDADGREDNAWDDNINQDGANSAYKSGATIFYLGKDWGDGITKTIIGFKTYGSNNHGFIEGSNPNVTVTLQGSTDNFSGSTVALGSIGPTTDANSLLMQKLTGITTTTPYRYHRLKIEQSGGGATIYVAEVQFYETEIPNMTLVSEATEAITQPDEIRIVIMEEDVDEITINTNFFGDVSRDDGNNWVEVTLEKAVDYASGKQILSGIGNVSGQAADKTIRCRTRSTDGDEYKIHNWGMAWK